MQNKFWLPSLILSSAMILVAFDYYRQSIAISGTVTFMNDPHPGCEVSIVGTGFFTHTDQDGKFILTSDTPLETFTLKVTSLERGLSAETHIENIITNTDDINLFSIPIISKTLISTSDYSQLSSENQLDYQVIRHWTEIIGYIHKHEIDTIGLRLVCPTNLAKQVSWRYVKSENKLLIRYSDWINCR